MPKKIEILPLDLYDDEEITVHENIPTCRANELDGKKWTQYSISIWSDIRKTPEEQTLGHPAMFPAMLAERLIEIFSKRGQLVLDPFAGVGSTLIAAKRIGRSCIGIELSPRYVEIAKNRLKQSDLLSDNSGEYHIINDDCNNLRSYVEANSIDLVVTSPPYWNILSQRRTADYKPIRDYGDNENDLGKIDDYSSFIKALQTVFDHVFEVLKPKAYCCVVVMDIRKKCKFYPYHSDLARALEEVGFIYDDLIIWDRRKEYNNLRPLGYPSVFRINKIHEFILIFIKP